MEGGERVFVVGAGRVGSDSGLDVPRSQTSLGTCSSPASLSPTTPVLPHAALLAASFAANASFALRARALSSLVTIASSPSFLASASFAALAALLAASAASPAVIARGAPPPPPPALAISMIVARPPRGLICAASGRSASSTLPLASSFWFFWSTPVTSRSLSMRCRAVKTAPSSTAISCRSFPCFTSTTRSASSSPDAAIAPSNADERTRISRLITFAAPKRWTVGQLAVGAGETRVPTSNACPSLP